MKHLESDEKSYYYAQGPLAWLNDIEITKGPYFVAILLLIADIVLIRQPFFSIDIPYAGSMSITLHEVNALSVFSLVGVILNVASVFALLVPLIKFFEWKYMWFVPAAVTSMVDIVAMAYIVKQKNNLLENTLIGYVYQWLTIEVDVTTTAWIFFAVNIVLLLCSIKMLTDIKNNMRTC